jgi:DNA-binding MarR family transcriptional regulator
MSKVKQKEIPANSATIAAADRLHSVAIHLLRRVRHQDPASGNGPAQLSALSVLVFGGAKTLGELAAAEQVTAPTMSRIVTNLERSKLIRITRDPADARRMQIQPTSKGTAMLQQSRQRRIEYLAAHLGTLSAAELARLHQAADIMEKLLQNWGVRS